MRCAVVFAALGLVLAACGAAGATDCTTQPWQIFYEHHQSAGASIFSIRGLALAQDASSVYFSHIQKANDGVTSPVDMVDGNYGIGRLDTTAALIGWVNSNGQAKSLATDNRGNVYAGMTSGQVQVYSASLAYETAITVAGAGEIGGVTVQDTSDGQHFLYTSGRTTGLVSCYNIDCISTPTLSWTYTLNAANLRGLAVDSSGNVWVANNGGPTGAVYRINSTHSDCASVGFRDAMDIAFYGGYAYVCKQDGPNSAVARMDMSSMVVLETLTSHLYDNSSVNVGLGGLDIDSNGNIFVASEDDYKADSHRDRIYLIDPAPAAPEPLTMLGLVMGLGGAGAYLRRRSRHKGR